MGKREVWSSLWSNFIAAVATSCVCDAEGVANTCWFAALPLSFLVMASSLVLHRSTVTKLVLPYRALKESILSIASDLDRALAQS